MKNYCEFRLRLTDPLLSHTCGSSRSLSLSIMWTSTPTAISHSLPLALTHLLAKKGFFTIFKREIARTPASCNVYTKQPKESSSLAIKKRTAIITHSHVTSSSSSDGIAFLYSFVTTTHLLPFHLSELIFFISRERQIEQLLKVIMCAFLNFHCS
jgi:hypothetical protein